MKHTASHAPYETLQQGSKGVEKSPQSKIQNGFIGVFMAKIIITKDNLPSLAEFKALLEQMEAQSSPLDDILSLLRDLVAFEQKYNMASDVFYARFMRGEMGDAMPFIEWAGQYELYLETKHELASQITTTVEQPDAEKIPVPVV